MGKNARGQKCIHCLQIPEEITYDHVIPESWYSPTHSKYVRKPKAPSCRECNGKLGAQEKLISHLMWVSMPETNPLRSELITKVYRSCGLNPDGTPMLGLSPQERRIRILYAQKLLSFSRPSTNLDERNIFPGFGYHAGYAKTDQRVVILEPNLILDVASKVVRGIEYIQGGRNRYIECPYRLEVYFPRDPTQPDLTIIREKCRIFFDGTNTIQRGANPLKPLEPIYIIRLWNQWEIWGVISYIK